MNVVKEGNSLCRNSMVELVRIFISLQIYFEKNEKKNFEPYHIDSIQTLYYHRRICSSDELIHTIVLDHDTFK